MRVRWVSNLVRFSKTEQLREHRESGDGDGNQNIGQRFYANTPIENGDDNGIGDGSADGG
jgi:hypothetical protein